MRSIIVALGFIGTTLAAQGSPVGADRSNVITLPEVVITAFDCQGFAKRQVTRYADAELDYAEELAECQASEVSVHSSPADAMQAARDCGPQYETAWTTRDDTAEGYRWLAFCHLAH